MEEYTENEPFETTEAYTENEPVEETRDIAYIIVDWGCSSNFLATGHDGWVEIRNTDDAGGTFSVEYRFLNVNGVAKRDSESYYLSSGQTNRFAFYYAHAWMEDVRGEYTVTCPTKTVMVLKPVQKTRTVTGVRTVTKTRPVTKTRKIQETLWEHYFA